MPTSPHRSSAPSASVLSGSARGRAAVVAVVLLGLWGAVAWAVAVP